MLNQLYKKLLKEIALFITNMNIKLRYAKSKQIIELKPRSEIGI